MRDVRDELWKKERIFTNFRPRPPEYKPDEIEYVSFFRRFDGGVEMELLYTPEGWIPTWKLSREKLHEIVDEKDIDVTFVVKVLEGSVIKRVSVQGGEKRTRLFIVTRFGLIEQLYDYERGVYVVGQGSRRYFSLKTGLKLEDVSRN